MEYCTTRFKNIEKQEYKLEVVTPLFLGGADPSTPELRSAPFKGMLRFWWRALNGSNDLKEMKRNEACIFGSTEKKSMLCINIVEASGIKVDRSNLPPGESYRVESSRGTFNLGIIDYLAYGLCEYNKEKRQTEYVKGHFEPKTSFTLELYLKTDLFPQVYDALKCFLLYGGIGARSRNGFGSLYCADIQEDNLPKRSNPPLKFTAFSKDKDARLFRFGFHDSWDKALSEIGMYYREARLSLEGKHVYERRSLLSRPIIQAQHNSNSRHSKPYFLHVHKIGENQFRGQILSLPYQYYDPKDEGDYKKVCGEMNRYFESHAKEATK